MSKRITTTCDRCKRDITTENGSSALNLGPFSRKPRFVITRRSLLGNSEIDLCDDCLNDLDEFLTMTEDAL